ncbi:MAG: T9SS type A sorting domain-containing protein [Bacteroidales bacterium]|nr:T9SS type A sorting domain-containing protein [Bacteroidales bacterium]
MDNIPVNIYPNPTTNTVHVSAEGLLYTELMDIVGHRIQTTNENIVNLADQPSGIYYLRITTKQGISSVKISKK